MDCTKSSKHDTAELPDRLPCGIYANAGKGIS
jgi:hypothetical protein